MDRIGRTLSGARLSLWLVAIFLFHAGMYLMLGTDTWLRTALLATGFYAVLLFILRGTGARRTIR